MTQEIVLTSLGELAGVRGLFAEAGPVPGTRALVPVIRRSGPEEIEALTRAARRALDELQVLLARDGERRREAEQGLGRLRALRGEAARLRGVASELGEAAGRAGALARSAFEPAAGQRAEGVAGAAQRLVNQAEAHAAVLEREAATLAGREDIARLLAEEQAQEEEARMRNELELAGDHLDGGRIGEARRLLVSVEKNISSVPDLEQYVRNATAARTGSQDEGRGGGAPRGAAFVPA